ncbi:outer membrane protein assembly factor BamB family protein [Halogeometricum borinquense]|uniref:WD40-like repeat protein n=2 Tax=Halogeometricum borinquense (strain ATCC 700274 / DSM 11551 / JCM 10706 / KCTC 4070 / PR3) TaxID=469382 RepID=E4NS68_HALBP|nr:PQQ-binding-like beta-propeller repeat protein [Halogeometricum borinquense]ADQ65753.1 WD40-like repeat protein [Halogeometricum borinquense DSM 11551]
MRPPRLTRRRLLAASGLFFAAGAAFDPSVAATPESDAALDLDAWPMPGRNPARTGFDPDGIAPRGDFSLAWETSVPDVAYGHRSLTVADGAVYVAADNSLLAVERDTGDVRWRFPGKTQRPWRRRVSFSASPVAFSGGVLIPGRVDTFGFGSNDGQIGWSHDSSPGDSLFCRVGNTVYWQGTDGTRVVDIETGLERERSPLSTKVEPFAFRNGLLVGRGDSPDKLVAVNAQTGRLQWSVTLGVAHPSHLTPCIGTDAVFYGSGPLYAVSLADGDVSWKGDIGTYQASIHPVTDGERVYAVAEDEEAETTFAVALDTETGDRVWRRETPLDPLCTPAVVGETLYAATPAGFVVLDATNGEVLARFDAASGRGRARSPAVVDGTVYVGLDETLYAVEGSE